MQKINKNYIYVVAVILIVGGLFLFQSRNKDLALEVINENSSAQEVENSDLTANLLSGAPKKMMTLKIYFPNPGMATSGTDNCREVFPVNRSIVETIAPARASLEELFRGPTTEEKELGFSTALSPDIKIQKLTINEGTATIDVNTIIAETEKDQCQEARGRTEITETLKQFLTVDNVSISVNGESQK